MSKAITDEMKYAAARAASSNTDDADARTVMLAVLGCAQAWVGDMRLIGNVRASDIVRAISAALSAGQAQPVGENAKLVELIKTRFLGVHPDELDCYLEYDDWTRIIASLSVPPEIEGGDKGDGWQTMDTAPKDGTSIDLWGVNHLTWDKRGERIVNVKWGAVSDWTGRERDDWQHGRGEDFEPTHWMPLPAAPSASIEGEKP